MNKDIIENLEEHRLQNQIIKDRFRAAAYAKAIQQIRSLQYKSNEHQLIAENYHFNDYFVSVSLIIQNTLERNKILHSCHPYISQICLLQKTIHHYLWKPHGSIARKLYNECEGVNEP